jgi:hypothetical protein
MCSYHLCLECSSPINVSTLAYILRILQEWDITRGDIKEVHQVNHLANSQILTHEKLRIFRSGRDQSFTFYYSLHSYISYAVNKVPLSWWDALQKRRLYELLTQISTGEFPTKHQKNGMVNYT